MLACLVVVLSGCTPGFWSERDAAQADAAVRLDAAIERIAFSEQAAVLGDGRSQWCGYADSGGWNEPASDYRCALKWVQVVVFPEAATREDVVAAIDAEIAVMGLETLGSAVRDLVLTHPNNAGDISVGVASTLGGVRVEITTRPFEPRLWPSPKARMRDTDLEAITPEIIAATGAAHVVIVEAVIGYWADGPVVLHDGDTDLSGPAFVDTMSAHGDNYSFDLAQVSEAEAEPCLVDPMVAPSSIKRVEQPFVRIMFKLFGAAESEDYHRVHSCLVANVHNGTLASYKPDYRGGETPSPVPTPGP